MNLPGSPEGAFFDQGVVLDAIVPGRIQLPPRDGVRFFAFCDLSGGSIDDATLAIGSTRGEKAIVDLVISQAGKPPFNPRDAVRKFSAEMKRYGIREVVGDAYAGQTFRLDFEAEGIRYKVSKLTTSEAYEAMEPRLNAGEVELPDVPKLQEQLLGLVMRGSRIDHQSGEHDDFAASVAGVVSIVTQPSREVLIGSCPMGGHINWQNLNGPKKRPWERRTTR